MVIRFCHSWSHILFWRIRFCPHKSHWLRCAHLLIINTSFFYNNSAKLVLKFAMTSIKWWLNFRWGESSWPIVVTDLRQEKEQNCNVCISKESPSIYHQFVVNFASIWSHMSQPCNLEMSHNSLPTNTILRASSGRKGTSDCLTRKFLDTLVWRSGLFLGMRDRSIKICMIKMSCG